MTKLTYLAEVNEWHNMESDNFIALNSKVDFFIIFVPNNLIMPINIVCYFSFTYEYVHIHSEAL